MPSLFSMTSEERKEARYQRRKALREAKRRAAIQVYDSYERVISANSLIHAERQSRKSVRFKASVQRYDMNLLRQTFDTRRKLKAGKNVTMGFICFSLCERGKTRNIRSVHFKERVVQRSLCDNALVPVLSRSLDYDNGASQKGKGIHFAINRCKAHLQQYYRENGFSNQGWVLQIDYSGYFDHIQHPPIYAMLDRAFTDKRIAALTKTFVSCFGEESLGLGSQVLRFSQLPTLRPLIGARGRNSTCITVCGIWTTANTFTPAKPTWKYALRGSKSRRQSWAYGSMRRRQRSSPLSISHISRCALP